MESNDRQQDDSNFGEVREDIFAGPFDGAAVSEDAGTDDWGGFPSWELPQEEQGFAEGEYDPGSDYDPGFIPEGELYEEPVDAPAADPWGSTQPLETVGQAGADAAVDENDIEMLSDDTGQAGSDVENNEIEMPPEYVGRADADAGDGE